MLNEGFELRTRPGFSDELFNISNSAGNISTCCIIPNLFLFSSSLPLYAPSSVLSLEGLVWRRSSTVAELTIKQPPFSHFFFSCLSPPPPGCFIILPSSGLRRAPPWTTLNRESSRWAGPPCYAGLGAPAELAGLSGCPGPVITLVFAFLAGFPGPLESTEHAGPPGLAEPSFGLPPLTVFTSWCFIISCWCCRLAAGVITWPLWQPPFYTLCMKGVQIYSDLHE